MVPQTVARDTLRSGLRTRPATTDAVSRPMKLKRAMAAAAEMAATIERWLGLKEPKLADLMKKSPMVAMNRSGTNLRTTVTFWNHPRLRIPEMLMKAGIQSPTMAMAADPHLSPPLLTNTST